VLYEYEIWSLILKEEYRLWVFENRVLRETFGSKRDEIIGDWRKLHNEELHNLYSLPNIIRMIKSRGMRLSGHVAHMGEKKGARRVLVGKAEGKRLLGRRRHRWEDSIKMNLQQIKCEGVDWIHLNQDRGQWQALVSMVINLRFYKLLGIS
jgi:hypothetical protein